ncbi:hypothetical protein [Bacillus thuringiensis]|uniref:hypothetical protein n=1 Tax=Bacillus thuringiensis TaxID=1428 RepID=UPI003B985891
MRKNIVVLVFSFLLMCFTVEVAAEELRVGKVDNVKIAVVPNQNDGIYDLSKGAQSFKVGIDANQVYINKWITGVSNMGITFKNMDTFSMTVTIRIYNTSGLVVKKLVKSANDNVPIEILGLNPIQKYYISFEPINRDDLINLEGSIFHL